MLQRPRLIGIAGPTCAGKTTLEKELQASLGSNVAILPFDDMTKEFDAASIQYQDDWEHPGRFRWEDYRRHLKQLKLGHVVHMLANGWESKSDGIFNRVVEPRPYVVSAGYLALYDPVARDVFDLKIYIDIPEEVIIERRTNRDQLYAPEYDPLPYILNYVIPANRQYVEPQKYVADFVLDGQQPLDEVVREVEFLLI